LPLTTGVESVGVTTRRAGDITDDDLLDNMGDVALGIETAYFYSAAHPSEKNKIFVEGMKRARPRPGIHRNVHVKTIPEETPCGQASVLRHGLARALPATITAIRIAKR